jgi:hypothetical protein
MLSEAVQIINRRVLVLENEEKTWLRAENYIHVQAPKAIMNKTLAFEVPLQTEPRFPAPQVRTTPLDGGWPAEQQKTDERRADTFSSSGDDDDFCPPVPKTRKARTGRRPRS